MKRINTNNPDRLVFRDDWGWFWRGVGWIIIAIGALLVLALVLPKNPPTAAKTTEDPNNPVLVIVVFALAGWCLYRRWIVIDRREGTVTIRRGVGLLSLTGRRRIDEFDHLAIHRLVDRNNRHIYYRVMACGKGGTLTIGTLDNDHLFDKPGQSVRFSNTVAGFTGWKKAPAPETSTSADLFS